jgi:hypothetical protein
VEENQKLLTRSKNADEMEADRWQLQYSPRNLEAGNGKKIKVKGKVRFHEQAQLALAMGEK